MTGKHAATEVLHAAVAMPLLQSLIRGAITLLEIGVSHLDIKPENLLISDNDCDVVYCDFGEAKLMVRYMHSPNIECEPNPHVRGLALAHTRFLFHMYTPVNTRLRSARLCIRSTPHHASSSCVVPHTHPVVRVMHSNRGTCCRVSRTTLTPS